MAAVVATHTEGGSLLMPEMNALAEPLIAEVGDVMEVVGGASSGGIIVREGRGKASPEASGGRLATGSVVRVAAPVEEDGRVFYELVSGAGPVNGWVSLTAAGKALLSKAEPAHTDAIMSKADSAAKEALANYVVRLTEARKAGKGDFIFDRTPASAAKALPTKSAPAAAAGATAGAELALEAQRQVEGANGRKANPLARLLLGGRRGDVAEDIDGEMVMVCKHCSLPLGEYGYAQSGHKGQSLLHGECMAQVMLQERRKEEELRRQKETELKQARREEYDIGWKAAETIPSNATSASKLGCEVVPQGLCCLVVQDDDSVRLAPTFEPAAGLNLEYLSIALQVRRSEGREPLFSLDPLSVEREAAEASMQMKRFEPEWLAGTSVGEVMFQADYHLKELSMGEYDQPVIGMKSCFDYNKAGDLEKEWSAREWFVVRKAEIHVSEDAVLIPYLKMGVEAREQLLMSDGKLEDAPLTRPDHPLVKYAEAFTHNFDLIAERKSVVCQLREVAKASIVAKFLLEAGVQLDEPWFNLGEQNLAACCLEVPQLWNDHCFSKIHMEDGEIVTSEKAREAKVHSVYGGVDFGIDRFRLAAPSRVATSVVAGRAALGRPASTLMATSQAGLSMAPGQRFTRLAAPLSARAALTAPSRLAPPLSARAGLAAPLSAMAAARPATSLMATSRASMAAPQARLAAPLRASMAAPSRLAAPLSARASLAAPLSAMAGARPATSLMATSRLSVGAPGRLAAPLSAMTAARPASSLMATSRISMAAPQTATARLSMGMPRGVDLNLDKFNLSAIAQDGNWAGTVEAPAGSENMSFGGKAFWENLNRGDVFGAEDGALLCSVFDAKLSDRRAEGELFVPPPTGLSYMHRLKNLVSEEAAVMQKRKALFFSAAFDMDDAGALFPSSWTSSIGLEGVERLPSRQSSLVPRPDLKAEEGMLHDVLASAAPVFEKSVEDGTKFLVYKLGSLEVRATRSPQGELSVGAVFSAGEARTKDSTEGAQAVDNNIKVVKATQYVQRAASGSFSYFSVLATEGGDSIVTELLNNGSEAWTVACPEDIAARCAGSKVMCAVDLAASPCALGELRSAAAVASAAKTDSKHHVKVVMDAAVAVTGGDF